MTSRSSMPDPEGETWVLCYKCRGLFAELRSEAARIEADPSEVNLCIQCNPTALRPALTRITLRGLESLT